MKKLPVSAHRFVMPFFLSMLMTIVVSGISIVRVAGFGGLREHWLGSWLWSWAIAYPALLLVFPIVRRIVSYLVEGSSVETKDTTHTPV
jgi:hypothetical protein